MSGENMNVQQAKRVREHRKNSLVGDCENLLPYAWNNPIVVDEYKCSKVLREMQRAEKQRLSPDGEEHKKA